MTNKARFRCSVVVLKQQLKLWKEEADGAEFCIKTAATIERKIIYKKKLNKCKQFVRSIKYAINTLEK